MSRALSICCWIRSFTSVPSDWYRIFFTSSFCIVQFDRSVALMLEMLLTSFSNIVCPWFDMSPLYLKSKVFSDVLFCRASIKTATPSSSILFLRRSSVFSVVSLPCNKCAIIHGTHRSWCGCWREIEMPNYSGFRCRQSQSIQYHIYCNTDIRLGCHTMPETANWILLIVYCCHRDANL